MSSINNNFVFGQANRQSKFSVYNNPEQKFMNMCKFLVYGSFLLLNFTSVFTSIFFKDKMQ